MLRTRFTDLFGVPVPLLLAPFGPWEQTALALEVCRAGGLASLGTAVRSVDELAAQWRWLRERTDAPFVINHTGRPLSVEAFEASLRFGPAALSFHMGIPAELVDRAHDSGIRWIQTVGSVAAAEAAIAAGADVLVAQGAEAGGNAGWVSTLVLVPAVVDVAGDVPVLAAGGLADGRGLAAALVLGAAGASMGTRFLATDEMAIDREWKQRIVAADAEEAVKVMHGERVLPPFTVPQTGTPFAPRALRTPLIDRLATAPETVDPAEVGPALLRAVRAGGGHDLLPFTGQSAQLVHDVVPAGELVGRLVAEAEHALQRARSAVRPLPGRVPQPSHT